MGFMNKVGVPVAVVAGIAVFLWDDIAPIFGMSNTVDGISTLDEARLAPNWAAIAGWPGQEADSLLAPDPKRVTTVIVLDDSGSMGSAMEDAKAAVLTAVEQMPDDGRVAVIALNRGRILDAMAVTDARGTLPQLLQPVEPSGGTPLGASMFQAFDILTAEAAQQRGFGTYRVLVTTDGQASDGAALSNAVERILSRTPIEVATIGIGIGKGHPLNMPGHMDYVSVSGVDGLAAALTQAAAEQTTFDPVTSFDEGN
ncbi:MAG: vWA domain-containing protein [Pseudomonadota bacterium]